MSGSASSPAVVVPGSPRAALLIDLLHLWVLSAFAISQPLLEQFSRNAPYMIEQHLSTASLFLVAFFVVVAVPTVLSLVEIVVGRLWPSLRVRCHAVFVGLLCLLFGSLSSRSLVWGYEIEASGLIDFVQAGVALLIAAGLIWLYYRTPWGRPLVSLAGFGLVIFPLSFAFSPTIRARWMTADDVGSRSQIQNPVPVVLVIFDGLSLVSLLDSEQQIDAVRYPNFARLAAMSDWFSGATTVHPRTDHAIPAILSGQYPVDGTSPVFDRYPHNLFIELNRSGKYDLFALEPYTRLCPEELQRVNRHRTLGEEVCDTLDALGRVYLKIAFPKNVSGVMPAIPREWFSLPSTFTIQTTQTEGLIRYGWDTQRETQVEHLLNGLHSSERPRLMFAHLAVPHYPYRFFPSGRSYTVDQRATMFPDGTHGVVGELWGPDELAVEQSWQRYLLQVGYVDHVVGRILDRLEETGLMDQCLLVITADHGCAFRAERSRREPDEDNLPDLLPVPLFIKAPGQRTGSKNPRNVELIDVLPTIADVLDYEWPGPLDGESVYATTPVRLRKTVAMRQPIVLDGKVPKMSEAISRKVRRFGEGPRDARFWSIGPHQEFVGRSLSDIPQDLSGTRLVTIEQWARDDGRDSAVPVIHSLFRGEIELDPQPQGPVYLAVSLGDKIVGVTRSFTDPNYLHRWALLIPEEVVDAHPEPVKVWELRFENDQPLLRSCRVAIRRGSMENRDG